MKMRPDSKSGWSRIQPTGLHANLQHKNRHTQTQTQREREEKIIYMYRYNRRSGGKVSERERGERGRERAVNIKLT